MEIKHHLQLDFKLNGDYDMTWKNIDSAPENCAILARDEDGSEHCTWKDEDIWIYEDWIDFDPGEEISIEVTWTPSKWFDSNA